MSTVISRRKLLKAASFALGGTVLAACQPQVVEVEKVVKETIEVEKEKVIKETVVVKEQVTQVVEKEKVVTATPSAGQCTMDWNPTLPPVPKKYEPRVQVSSPFTTSPQWLGSDNITNNPLYNRLLENMGIEFKAAWETGDSARLTAAIAANELPDSFSVGGATRDKLILDGALEDVKAIWETTASPLVIQKKGYPDRKWWLPVLKEGKVFGVPYINGPGYNIDNIGLIRQDWLDKVGLAVPETLDDLDKTMRAFVEAGLATYGINCNSALVTWARSLDPIFGAFGVMPTIWLKEGDGKLKYGSIFPTAKDGLAVIRKWYEDGLIDPDYYTYSVGDAGANLLAGKVGITFTPWWEIRQSVMQAEEQNPGANFVLMEAPAGPGGKRGRKASDIMGPHVVFKKGVDPIKVEAVINQLNWNMEIHVNFDKYQQYGELWDLVEMVFEEGYAWAWDDNCELAVGPGQTTTHYTQGWAGGFWFQQLCYDNYLVDVGSKIDPWFQADPATLNKAQRFIIRDPLVKRSWDMYKYSTDRLDQQYVNEFVGSNTKNMAELLPELNKLESEYFTALVIGSKPLDAFDEFVNLWQSTGGDKVTADVNAWYASQVK